MAQASSQHKLDRVRPPRVHITYDVEIGDAIEVRTLPFQLGILGDFSGSPSEPLARIRDRKFVEVNPDNFNEVLEAMKPRVAFSVENHLAGPGAPQLRVDLHFHTLDDFEASHVARQIKPLREMLELRVMLNDLLGKLQGNDRLEELLEDILSDPIKLKKLESEIHAGQAAKAAAEPPKADTISNGPGPVGAAVLDEPKAEDLAEAEEATAAEEIGEVEETGEVEVETEAVGVAEEPLAPPVFDEPLTVPEEEKPVALTPEVEAHAEAPVEVEAPAEAQAEIPVEVPVEEGHASPAPEAAAAVEGVAVKEKPHEKQEEKGEEIKGEEMKGEEKKEV